MNKKEILNKTLFYRYMQELSPFSDDMCRNCELLPICSGGCGWYRYKNRYENGSFDICSMYKGKELLEKALLNQIKTNQ
ncbi:SPASM domain-containing protein [Bacteroides pyogenes]|uniref:SPASM domain-containing protein n=1 Tax=Bacteroides pyogenes TaxID=310300 RepID=UPI003D1613A7